MNITLPCRHVFTVRELDSITCIHEFYEQDSGGIWTKPTIPKTSGVRNRPMCPRCGGNIDSLRYGRVLKNSNDSILQHNIACNLSERLSKAQEMWSESRKELEKRVISTIRSFGTTSIPIPSENTRQTLRQRTESAVPKGCPTTLDLVQNIGKFHGFPPRHTKAWRKAVEDISETYRTAYDVACEPDPSAQAYDRSIFRLYREELNKSGGTADPTTDPVEKRRQQLASDAAHIAIGQLRPRSSDRFKAEAFWMTIEILVTLGLAISKACDESQDRRGANAICWDNIAAYFLSQACKDAETALSMAEKSRSPNKIVQCQLLILQIQYEVAAHKCRLAIRSELLLNPERRDEYLDMCTHGVMNVQNLRVTVPQDYQGRARRESAAGVNTTRADWVREHFIEPTQNILDAWNNLDLIIDVNMPGWRREDANAERLIYWKPIVQEAAASRRKCHTERFNQCSRGHPYVKGECHVSVGVGLQLLGVLDEEEDSLELPAAHIARQTQEDGPSTPTQQTFRDASSRPEDSTASNFPGLSNDSFSVAGTNHSPGQTHNLLRQYVDDSFRFSTVAQVYRFVSLLCNASTRNSSWTLEEGQPQGNGILRLGDAIRFPAENNGPWSFQRGYIPILTYLSSDWVTKSRINTEVNALYGLVHNEFPIIRNTIETHMQRLMAARSFNDGPQPLSGKQVFKVIFVTLFEYLTRIKEATIKNPDIRDLAEQMGRWFDEWVTALRFGSSFSDECNTYDEDKRQLVINNIRADKERVLRIVQREKVVLVTREERPSRQGATTEGLIATLQRNCDYDGPGERREKGPRHDNDKVSISDIRVAPTNEELACYDDPFLPGNFAEAPHFYDSKSVERLIDVQFRLLREELIAPIRMATQLIMSDLRKPDDATTILSKLIKDGGGRYRAPANTQESVIFSVFPNVTFQPLSLNNRGTSVGIEFDTPPGKARDKQTQPRVEYWEQVSKKRLMLGGLVALVWKDLTGSVDIYVGTVASTPRDLAEAAKKSKDRIALRVSFFDAAAELRIVQSLQNRQNHGTKILIEAPVFYEGIRPFLEALKADPARLPFAQYLVHQSEIELQQTMIAAPLYSRTPGFSFELKDLFSSSAGVPTLRMSTTNPDSVANARNRLRNSRLDPSQAEAVIDSLTREVSLIQGPPGTGKSYTGLELIRVLIKNQISPILLVAYTNHALDHMLKGILDADITKNLIRLGSRSAVDERLASFSLDEAEKISTKSRLDRNINAAYREMRAAEAEMSGLMQKITERQIPQEHMEDCILSSYPFHYEELFSNMPSWISTLVSNAAEADGEWETVGKTEQDLSVINYWATGRDLQFLEGPKEDKPQNKQKQKSDGGSSNKFGALADGGSSKKGKASLSGLAAQHQAFLLDFLSQHGLHQVPAIPRTARPLEALKEDPMVWSMSLTERNTLYDIWYATASESIRESQIEDFENLRKKHAAARQSFEEIKEQGKVNILRRSHIIGCTTTGAAKVVSLLSGVEPKVMIVEEAGQVLESHILASLVESVQHIIMIGDPLQLRPKLATDNPHTGHIWKFDQSLMERLSKSGFPMSQIDVQRRMRPAISTLIRRSLYPNLKDHELVKRYPDVYGMRKNVFFIDMIYDLVLHLLRQGTYNKEGNIVVLAAYLGQIPKIRQRLRDIVTTIVDERDAELLEQHGIEDEETTTVQEVKVSKHVLIRTLDNFQGEEGEVVILSLVRNSGTPFDGHVSSLQYTGGRSTIGFLRSKNRTNVGLSRAKHGMYIFGNAPELARASDMWATILQELHQSGSIGDGLPITCQRHPDYVEWVDACGHALNLYPAAMCALSRYDQSHNFKPYANGVENHVSVCVPSITHAIESAGSARRLLETADSQFEMSNCRVGIYTRLLHAISLVCQKKSSVLPKSKSNFHLASTKQRCLAAKIQPHTRAKNHAELASRVALNHVRPNVEHARNLVHRILEGHELDVLRGLNIQNIFVVAFYAVGIHAKTNASKGIPVRVHAKKSVVKYAPMAHVVSHARHLATPVCSLAPGTVNIYNARLLAEWHAHDFPATKNAPIFCDAVIPVPQCVANLVLDKHVDLEDDGSLDSMTITLPCGHVFTVETLDGITSLGDFYEKDGDGKWVKSITPDDTGEIRTRPVCPSCRGNIDSRRYGRVCKNSNLAILQHNTASSLSRRLATVEAKIATVRERIDKSVIDAIKSCKPEGPDQTITTEARREMVDKRDITLAREHERPTPAEVIEEIDKFHGFAENYAKSWKGGIKVAIESYRVARQITCERDPAVQAYEASLSQLYREELDRFGVDLSLGAPRDVEQQALRVARAKIGQLPPRASLRFVVEAFWITVDILMQLGVAVSKASDEVRIRDNTGTEHHQWEQLAEFILDRAAKDAETAYKLANNSESWNKAIKCQVFVLQTHYELAAHQCRVAIGKGALSDSNVKAELVDMCRQGIKHIKGLQTSIPQEYSSRWGPRERQNKLAWANTNFVQPSNVILESWETLKRSAKGGTWYQEVTNAERSAIMRAMMQGAGHDRLWHTGHFYQCPNGHPYVIGECGGAMQVSTCPECGAAIGGSHHQSLAGNTHANEFVNLARQGGVEDAGWEWGPGRRR
ncbi:P-loop containing nucleoside triphosphate hydrolase protein, partial [Rhizoctonia solani]